MPVGLGAAGASHEAAAKNRYLFLGDRLNALPGSFRSFLATDLLSWRGKLALLWERFRKRRSDAGDESIDAFARRRAGAEAADVFADALVTGIYAGDPKLLSLPACFPRLAELEREFGSVIKGFAAAAKKRKAQAKARGVPDERPGKMWSLPGGLRVLVETLTAQLKQTPIYGVAIGSIEKTGAPQEPVWRIRADGQDRWEADAAVLTCPAYSQATILAELDAELAREIGGIAYNCVAVVALGYRQSDVPMSLDGFGFIAPQRTRRDLLGVQWCSSIYPGRAPAGCVLMRAMCGGWRVMSLPGTTPGCCKRCEASCAWRWASRRQRFFTGSCGTAQSDPQYHLGHLGRVARIEQRLGHRELWLGGNAYHGVALNDCTEQGMVLAGQIERYVLR